MVARTAQYLSGAGIGVLCFNFRGVGQSEGEWAGGEGERSDVEAAVDHVLGLAPNARLTVAGYSFGAWVGLSVGASDRRVDTLVGIAPPVILYPFDFLRCSAKPKLLIYAGRDKIVTPWAMTEWIDRVAPPKAVRCLPDADHYFSGRADDVAEAVTTFVSRL